MNIANAIDIISQLNPVTYTWNLLGQKRGGKADVNQYGFLAQEVESILPSAVTTSADGYKSLNYIDFIPYLVASMKDLIQKDSVIFTKIDALSGSLLTLKNSYDSMQSSLISIKNTLDNQSLALSQMQILVADLESQIQAQSGQTATVVNNYYTTIVQTGSSEPTETVVNNYYTITGTTDTGSIVWTHSGDLLTQMMSTGTVAHEAVTYIQDMIDRAQDVAEEIVALQITAVHGFFTEIWTKKITTETLVASGATIENAHIGSLCLKKSDNTEICLSGDQVELLLSSAPVTATGSIILTGSTEESTSSGETLTESGSLEESPTEESTSSGETLTESGSFEG